LINKNEKITIGDEREDILVVGYEQSAGDVVTIKYTIYR
jgi:hypothetical protein